MNATMSDHDLRNLYAGFAMQTLLAAWAEDQQKFSATFKPDNIPELAFIIADEMMDELGKRRAKPR